MSECPGIWSINIMFSCTISITATGPNRPPIDQLCPNYAECAENLLVFTQLDSQCLIELSITVIKSVTVNGHPKLNCLPFI